MRKKGSISDCARERNRDLFRAYRELLESSAHIELSELLEKVVNMPAKRFWVSEERAAIVIADMMRGCRNLHVGKNKMEMFNEIFRRALKVKAARPELTVYEIAKIVVNQRAPKFYLTTGSARVILFYEKKKWYEERKKNLRHMFQ